MLKSGVVFLVFTSCLFSLVSLQNVPFLKYVSDAEGFKKSFLKEQFNNGGDTNEQPIIGILTQTLEVEQQNDTRFENYTSYIMSTYANFLMGAGARVVPLIYSESEEEILAKLEMLDGVLFPGGDGDFGSNGPFIFNKVLEFNRNGTYYPMWGTCMGFQNMTVWASSAGFSVLQRYEVYQTSLNLSFVTDPRDTQMYGGLEDEAFFFEDHNLTYNSHNWASSPEIFETDAGLNAMYKVTAISYMPGPDYRPFVVSFEGKEFPVFGTLFHPEQTAGGFYYPTINHSWLSIKMNRHFADYFVWQSRHNPNTYPSWDQAELALIENYDNIVTTYNQGDVYVFH